MAQKCVHSSCGKVFSNAEEPCYYHPGPPVFHEGQKGWKCCKPRVLTFDEFLSISPCTTGKHSVTDKPPTIEKKQDAATVRPETSATTSSRAIPRLPVSAPPRVAPSTPNRPVSPADSEDDDPELAIPIGMICKRRACGEQHIGKSRDGEICRFHPGAPIFHEGSKGYTCCKRRVLEFDEFMKISGCKTRAKHLFLGSRVKKGVNNTEEEAIESVRHDFYQTADTVIASFFLKKIDPSQSEIRLQASEITLRLITTDAIPKRYNKIIPLFGSIDTEASTYKIYATKLEVKFVKAVCISWPVLRSDEQQTGEIIQAGKAGNF